MATEGHLDVITETVPALSGLGRQCPHCGSEKLKLVVPFEVMGSGPTAHLLCTDCYRCWYDEEGRVEQVDRYLCPGCPERLTCLQPLIYGTIGA